MARYARGGSRRSKRAGPLVGASIQPASFLAGTDLGRYTVAIPVDFGYFKNLINGIALPAVDRAKEIYAPAERRGLGPQDFAAVYRWLSQPLE